MEIWRLQEAKACMSELVKRAQTQPQVITLHGKSVAVVISHDTVDRLSHRLRPTTRRLRPRASLYKRRRRRQRPDGGRFNDPDTICKGPEALTS